MTYFHQRFKIARVTLDLQASAFPRGELSSTWCEGVHGTLNSKIHYVAGICSFDAEYTSTFDQKTLLKHVLALAILSKTHLEIEDLAAYVTGI